MIDDISGNGGNVWIRAFQKSAPRPLDNTAPDGKILSRRDLNPSDRDIIVRTGGGFLLC
jgi:hypothetical protein